MKCPNCKKKLSNSATFCKYCGKRIEIASGEQIPHKFLKLKNKKFVLLGIIIIVMIFYALLFKCKAGLCMLPSEFKGEYCVIHTCSKKGCYNKIAKGKKYCYTHLPSTADYSSYRPEKAEEVLTFSDIKVSNNSSYTICNATITNNGRRTYTFIEVKGKFKNSSGTILDTDWTYAVGSEGLEPGESATIRLSVSKNYNISNCSLEVYDYEKD